MSSNVIRHDNIIPLVTRQSIASRYHAVTKAINREFWNSKSETTHSFYVGSYGRNTAINTSDIDILIEIPGDEYNQYSYSKGNGQSRLLQAVKNAQIILTALSSCGFFASIITNKVILTWVGGIAAVLSLCLNLYAKEYKIQNEVSQHRNAANALWGIREGYVSLLVDFEVLEDSEIQKRRDVLCNKVSEVNSNYPATDERSYRTAQRALQKEEEQTFKENEVDSILPNGIDK